MRARAPFGVFVATMGVARFVHAAASPLTVERAPGAEDCPDTAGLVARVEAVRGAASHAEATAYRVTFARGPRGFSAAIRAAADSAIVRNLEAREPSCAALAHATAVALAVLFDADSVETRDAAAPSSEEKAPSPAPARRQPQRSAAADAIPVEPADREPNARIVPLFSAGGAILAGVLRPAVPALVADAGAEWAHFRGTAGVLWVAPQTIDLAPGQARDNLFSGSMRICYAPFPCAVVRVDACSGLFVGAATAEARGFTTNERHTELFVAFPLELAISARSHFIGWQVGAAALVPAPPHEFDVEGLGATYRPPSVAGMFSLRVLFGPTR
jgi:hypothetical protein